MQAELKERSLLLDMYKSAPKETRDKVGLMAAEKKVRSELEEARGQLKKMSETKKEEKKKLVDEDAARRIKQLEDQVEAGSLGPAHVVGQTGPPGLQSQP